MRSIKIENARLGVQFAFGGFDGHKQDNRVAVVTRKGANFLLTTDPGTKDALSREMKRDERILVDYDTSTVSPKVCAKDPEHGPKVANPSARLTCTTCHVAYHAAKREAKRNGTLTPRQSSEAAKAEAAKRIADAKIDRLMSLLEARGLALHQQPERVYA